MQKNYTLIRVGWCNKIFEGLNSQKYNSLSEFNSAVNTRFSYIKKVTFIDNHMQQKLNKFEVLVESANDKVCISHNNNSHNNNQLAFPKPPLFTTIPKHAKMLTSLFISHNLTFSFNNKFPFSNHLKKMLETGNPLPEKACSPNANWFSKLVL